MYDSVGGAILLLVLFIIYRIINSFVTSRNQARRAAELGCKPPFVRQHRWALGLDFVQRIIRADKAQRVVDDIYDIYEELGHATWAQKFFGPIQIATCDPKNIQAMLATQFEDFEIPRQRRRNFLPLTGDGIFTTNGKYWEHSRSMLRPQFAREQVADLNLEEIHVQDLFKHLPTGADGWTSTVDLQPLFFRLTLDSATEFLFGESANSQISSLPDSFAAEKRAIGTRLDWSTFGPAWDIGTMGLGRRGRLSSMYWLYQPKAFREACKEVHYFADYYVNLALTTDIAAVKHKNLENGPSKDKYVFLQELVRQTRDPVELKSQLLNILLAGRDTTAGLLGWVFYLLVRHSRVFDKLREDILASFGTYSQPRNITFSSLKGCSYLQQVMSETLRLYTTVPLNGRTAVHDTTLPRGGGPDESAPIFVKKGQVCNYMVHVMHRRKDIWGEDAHEFRPERFAGRKSGWEFLPFNGGPRICLGQQFALTEAGYVIVRMLQKYDKLINEDSYPVARHLYGVTTSPVAVKIRLHEAHG